MLGVLRVAIFSEYRCLCVRVLVFVVVIVEGWWSLVSLWCWYLGFSCEWMFGSCDLLFRSVGISSAR